ncbi:iron-sulfur cluster assembly scaffold protein NifU [Microbacterium nanhaiense]|uniref:Iron-sulfur cluster assembly scaffold protein NifU n=1 Tax=Microbacterium nanhaiense TaxID=1301026 RepID=A0ABQ2N031_9MICO|nr:SUF system NifU family Fe-S cluster assembly protein [Microbacterium nanhaiense]GGO61655.1 iron-sulfur cluster assembly scaffold protein NifU [Microbacterium nanhaiense]
MSNALEQMYQELILDHAKSPEGKGDPSVHPFTHHELNPSCGDEITLGITVEDGRIAGLAWDGDGCSISMSSASIMSELLEGATREDALRRIDEFREMMRSRGAVAPTEELGDAAAFQNTAKYVMRIKCAMLAWVALEADVRASLVA